MRSKLGTLAYQVEEYHSIRLGICNPCKGPLQKGLAGNLSSRDAFHRFYSILPLAGFQEGKEDPFFALVCVVLLRRLLVIRLLRLPALHLIEPKSKARKH